MKPSFASTIIHQLIILLIIAAAGCSQGKSKSSDPQKPAAQGIGSVAELNSILESSGDRLLMFDLYADWCGPCRLLSPVLDRVASDLKSAVTFYKINIDKHPDIAAVFQVSGIPFVVFVKNRKVVQAYMGVQPEAAYRRAITAHGTPSEIRKDNPDGELVGGVRIIPLSTAMSVGDLYVYRGEEVKLVFEKVDFEYAVHIPAFKASGSARAGEKLVVGFKAVEAGVFAMMCNGKCPAGDGQQFARINVLEYEHADTKALFRSIDAKEASALLAAAAEKPFVLDVRTPNEYYEGHIAAATLIPLQQLGERIGELDGYKDRPILVYCRSGNRSIPAAQILIRNGFKKVYNLKNGITGWINGNLPVEKPL